jgi:hypothetical protein
MTSNYYMGVALLLLLIFSPGGVGSELSPLDSDSAAPRSTSGSRVTLSAEPKGAAWWLRVRFEPIGQTVLNVPVSSLDSSWQLASELSKDLLKPEILGEDGWARMEANRLGFARTGDFNSDGISDLALVGMYKDREGVQGNFLVVLTKSSTGGWQKTFLKSWPGHAGFLAIDLATNRIRLWKCMECDMPDELAWDEEMKRYILVPPSPYQ